MTPALADAEARWRVDGDLEHSLVMAGAAGTGKTAAVVSRAVALVRAGTPPGALAVVTFSEAAAAELRARLSEALAADGDDGDDQAVASAAASLDDAAAVGTVHSFARRILQEHAPGAGLPPRFEVLDHSTDRARLRSQLVRFTDSLLDDQEAETMLLRGFVMGLDASGIFDAAWSLHRHWDRLDADALERLERERPAPGPWPVVDVGQVLDGLGRAQALEQWCTHDEDLLLAHLKGRLGRARALLATAADDPRAALTLLLQLPPFTSISGQRGNWAGRLDEVRDACAAAERTRQDVLEEARRPVVAEMLARLARFTADAAARRAAEGRLTLHDLVVRALTVLRTDDEARAALRRRYRVLLVDELQDTDPLQVELAGWLASSVEGTGDLVPVRPGALFAVGDPQPPIHRFRRADVEMSAEVSTGVEEELTLCTNLRSVPGIVRFVNAVLPPLYGEWGEDGTSDERTPEPGHVAYRPMVAHRPPLPARPGAVAVQLELEGLGGSDDPTELAPSPVVVLGGPLDRSAPEVRRAAARDLGVALRRAVSEGWVVSDPSRPGAAARRLQWRDIAVLIPTRASLPPLEEALDEAEVPYRLDGAELLWGSQEIEEVLCALRAADEPLDAVSVLAALRSSGLACGDDDLVEWHSAGGSWDPRAEAPTGLERHAVARGMSVLAALHRRRWWTQPGELVAAAIEDMHGYELAFCSRRPRQAWRRLRWLATQARQFDRTVGGPLADFVGWADLQRQGDGGGGDSRGPIETDDDAVRVMTVHGAKGLEFPMVAVSRLEADETTGHRPDAVLWDGHGRPEIRLSPQLNSTGYPAAAASERRLDRLERVRRLYVAMTCARDHLVLCLHHRAPGGTPGASQAAALSELCRTHPLLWRRLPMLDVDPGALGTPARAPRSGAPHGGPGETRRWAAALGQWSARREQMVARSGTLRLVTADGGDPGDSDRSAAISRAVRATLAVVDLHTGRDATGTEADAVSVRAARLHGVSDRSAEVAAMVGAALSSRMLRHASERAHHQELQLSMAVGADGEAVFESRADLLVEDDDGLVVVGYESDQVEVGDSRAHQATRRIRHSAACAVAAEAATGRQVVRVVLLFLGPRRAWEHCIDGQALAEAKESALQAMAESR